MESQSYSRQALVPQRPVNLIGAFTRMVVATALLEMNQWWRLLRTAGRDLPTNFRQSRRVLSAWAAASASELPPDLQRVYGRIDDLLSEVFGDGTSDPVIIGPEVSTREAEAAIPDAPAVAPRTR